MGSASSLIAFHEAGMKQVVGFEIDGYMYDKSLKRYQQEIAQVSIQDMGIIE